MRFPAALTIAGGSGAPGLASEQIHPTGSSSLLSGAKGQLSDAKLFAEAVKLGFCSGNCGLAIDLRWRELLEHEPTCGSDGFSFLK